MGIQHSIHQIRHGHAFRGKKTRTYKAWSAMRVRVEGRTPHAKKVYKDRGITVCERWQTFENFLADMGECPPKHSLDRIDNDKGYEPGNCRWADDKTQMGNRTVSTRLTYNGVTLHLSEWARRLGIQQGTLSRRLNVYGWSVERALSTDPSAYFKRGSKRS